MIQMKALNSLQNSIIELINAEELIYNAVALSEVQLEKIDNFNQRIQIFRSRIKNLDPENKADLEKIRIYNDRIHLFRLRIAQIIKAYQENKELTLQDAKQKFLNLKTSNEIEDLYRITFLIQISYMQKPSFEILKNNIAEIEFLSNLCPYKYGKPVYMAREWRNKISEKRINYNDENCRKTNSRSNANEYTPKNEITIFPNPSNGLINIQTNSKIVLTKISIYNQQGINIMSKNIDRETNKLEFNLSDFSSGIYYFVGISDNITYREKFILIND